MRLSTVLAVLVIAPAAPASAQSSLDDPVCPEQVAPFFAFCDWELRPDSAEWLPLLAPAGDTILGTPGDDTLAAGGEGDVVSGLGGDDALSSGFDRTELLGGDDEDDLSTDAVAAGEAVAGIEAQLGGRGDDTHRATLRVTGFDALNEQLIDLGPGEDQVDGRSFLDSFISFDSESGVANQVFGRDGDDAIAMVADAQNFFGNSLALNAVDGGKGDDHIVVRAVTEFDGNRTIADNRVSGGDGNDVVDATAINWPNEPISASNLLLGGRGHDVLHALMLTDSNVSHSIGSNELWGGDGDDELDAIHETDGENSLTDLTTLLDGGRGDDDLSADSRAWGENVLTSHVLRGGTGDDTLTLALDVAVFEGEGDGDADSDNVLEGGAGDDRLEATVTRTCEEEDLDCDLVAHAENHLDGGSGNDVLVASIDPDVSGASFASGGTGNDELTVSGGSGNELDGGIGKDSLFAGDGDDRISGGKDRDSVYFDLSVDQGSDTLADFDARRDVLKFAGIEDLGTPGLADDLDAISSFDDQGPAKDVVIDLASGSQLAFAGFGTGEVDSWSELLPPKALRQWEHEKKPASRPVAARASRAAALPELGLLPRDHH
jgi:Ca2+-binding RTX toxin-like protein